MRVMAGSVVLVVVAGMGCDGSDDTPAPSCGNNICESGEDHTNCTKDCGYCGPCGPLHVCSQRICVPSFIAGTYAITIGSGRFPPTRSNGMPWDLDGPPDPYAAMVFGTTTLGTGDVIADSEQPLWNDRLPGTVSLIPGDKLRLDVYDEDGATDELMFSCTTSVTTIQVASDTAYGYACIMESSQVSGWVGFTLTLQ